MSTEKYNLRFVDGGLFVHESIKLCKHYRNLWQLDWDEVRKTTEIENLIEARPPKETSRILDELVARLKTLSIDQIESLTETAPNDQHHFLWLAICRRYCFIAEFAQEVLHERLLTLRTHLGYGDFDSFFRKKSASHKELSRIQPAAQEKLCKALFLILHEVGYLDDDLRIRTAKFTPCILDQISGENPQDLLFFPVFESDLKRLEYAKDICVRFH